MEDPSIQNQIVPDILIPFSMVFMGAFFGAGFAYLIQRKEKKKERRNADIGAVLETSLYLHMMWNEVLEYRNKFIEPVRNDIVRSITMRPVNKLWIKA